MRLWGALVSFAFAISCDGELEHINGKACAGEGQCGRTSLVSADVLSCDGVLLVHLVHEVFLPLAEHV